MNQQSSPEQVLNWMREEAIAVPSPGRETRMAIRRSDWERLKRRLSRVVDSVPRMSVVYSILFGIAATSGFSIIPIAASTNLPSWVTPFYVCVCAFSLFCGIVFVCIDRKVRSGKKSELQDIGSDMNEIEGMFERQNISKVLTNKSRAYKKVVNKMAEWSNRYSYTDSNVDVHAPTSGGVYRLIYERDEEYYVFYVGQSDNLERRLHEHLSPSEPDECIKRYLGNYSCYFRFIEIASQAERDNIEKREIEEYSPPCSG